MKSDLNDLLAFLKPAMDLGCRFEIYVDEGVTTIDLNTGAKSGCKLKLETQGVRAYRRYDRVDSVDSFEDVMWLVYDCAHGRSFFNDGWLAVFEANDISDPRGSL